MSAEAFREIHWLTPDGEPVSCIEKLKVLTETLSDLEQAAQDAFEDAILMGCDEAQVRGVLERLVREIRNPYRKPA